MRYNVIILSVIFILFMAVSCFRKTPNFYRVYKLEIYSSLKELAEKSYMEGQIDAISGDIRVKKIEEDYKWMKCPWDDNTPFTFEYYSQYNEE